MTEVSSFLASLGLDVGIPVLDGKVQRVSSGKGDKKKSGWYIGFQNHSNSGQVFFVVRAGNFKTGEVSQFNSDDREFDKYDRERIKKQIEEAKRKAEKERADMQESVAIQSQKEFDGFDRETLSDYHVKKKLSDLHGARSFLTVRMGRIAYIPMRDIDGKMWGLQKIQPDGGKYFSPGQRVDGTMHIIGDIEQADRILICEGFATGASLFEATGRATVCAFTAKNLITVAAAVKAKYPERSILICGDDDLYTLNSKGEAWNPGREAAEEAGKRALCSVTFPAFEKPEKGKTDFNDLHVAEGLEAVKRHIEPIETQYSAVIPLGFHGEEYFFTSTDNPTIVRLTSFSEVQCFNLMRKEYWEAVFPNKNGIDWSQAKSHLMSQCRARGIFEPRNVRGSGVWVDDDRVVVNLGNRLRVGEKEMPVNAIKSRFFYTLGRSLPEVSSSPLTLEECDLLLNICDLFRWRQKEYGRYVAGMIVISKICGALPIRPHLWITGGSQTGKSTLLERLIYPTLRGYSLYFQGGTSEAGLRQAAGTDSMPIIFDEFETTGKRSSENIQACVELMRSAWSETNGYVVKGSAGGTAMFYQPRFSAIVSSIRPNLTNDADRSRFAIVELAPHGSDSEHWKKLDHALLEYDETYVQRLFARTLKMTPIILENYKLLRRALSQKVSARFGQQYGMLLAGFSVLMSDGVLTKPEIEILVDHLGLEDEREEAAISDEEECLSFLMQCVVSHTTFQGIREDRTIGSLVEHASTDGSALRTLNLFGLAADNSWFYVSNSNPKLRQLFSNGGDRWVSSWPRSLLRIKNAERGQKKLGHTNSRVVKIPR